jgi:hypothetical protein
MPSTVKEEIDGLTEAQSESLSAAIFIVKARGRQRKSSTESAFRLLAHNPRALTKGPHRVEEGNGQKPIATGQCLANAQPKTLEDVASNAVGSFGRCKSCSVTCLFFRFVVGSIP